jgi:hypothetical protein
MLAGWEAEGKGYFDEKFLFNLEIESVICYGNKVK